ncbi:MAG: fructosamine kinase family protein [Rhodospirillales bacterium]|nr:fructosamine kinase family protein [Rhodospirillales bacterium]
MKQQIADAIARATGARPVRIAPMGGGCVGDVARVELADGRVVVAKTGDKGSRLDLEGFMLDYLRDNGGLPVPEVLHAADDLLVMSFIETSGGITDGAQVHAAEILARLHAVTADRFGFARPTAIGGLRQPNPWTASWRDFFRDQRLLYMARQAFDAGRLPKDLLARVERLALRLESWIGDDAKPSLIHGDLWTGNVLVRGGRVAGFVDPAIYYADAEIELAFSTLFGTFGAPFFARYAELRAIAPGFFEERRELYNLYPLLVHVRLFGGHYVGSVEATLKRFGC